MLWLGGKQLNRLVIKKSSGTIRDDDVVSEQNNQLCTQTIDEDVDV